MYDIIGIGDIKLDTFIAIPDASVECELKDKGCKLCIDHGKKNIASSIELQIAGSAPNVAVGIARMKKKAGVYSVMGKDPIYRMALEFLKKHNVQTRYIKTQKGTNSSFAAVLNYKGESTQLVSHNHFDFSLPSRFPRTKWIHLSELGAGYKKLFDQLIKLKKKKGVKISFNPGVVQLDGPKKPLKEMIAATDVLFLNRVEALGLINAAANTDIKDVLQDIKKMGPEYVVVTDGRDGAYAYDGDAMEFAPMFPGERVEATGAGDSFTTGFIGALMHGKDHAEALKWASVNAANVVQHIGPTKGLLSNTEILRDLKARPSYKTKKL